MKIFNKILTLTLAFFLTLCSFKGTNVLASDEYSNGKDIEIELKDVDLSVFEDAGKTDVIYLSETGFGTKDYNLIVYVYNHDKKPLVQNTVSNVINMACRFAKNEDGEYKPVEYAPTSQLLTEIKELEAEIQKGIADLENML